VVALKVTSNASVSRPKGTSSLAVVASTGSHRAAGSVAHTVGAHTSSAHRARLAPWSTFGPSLTPNGSSSRAAPSTKDSFTDSVGTPNTVVSM
jgi:hypothetical protein